MVTGCKLGGTEGSAQPLCLAYSSDGTRLIGLLQVARATGVPLISSMPCRSGMLKTQMGSGIVPNEMQLIRRHSASLVPNVTHEKPEHSIHTTTMHVIGSSACLLACLTEWCTDTGSMRGHLELAQLEAQSPRGPAQQAQRAGHRAAPAGTWLGEPCWNSSHLARSATTTMYRVPQPGGAAKSMAMPVRLCLCPLDNITWLHTYLVSVLLASQVEVLQQRWERGCGFCQLLAPEVSHGLSLSRWQLTCCRLS